MLYGVAQDGDASRLPSDEGCPYSCGSARCGVLPALNGEMMMVMKLIVGDKPQMMVRGLIIGDNKMIISNNSLTIVAKELLQVVDGFESYFIGGL